MSDDDDDDDVLLASVAIIISSVLKVFLMKDLVLDDDLLNLEYGSGAGFKNLFHMITTSFETLLNMIGPKVSKCDTRMRS